MTIESIAITKVIDHVRCGTCQIDFGLERKFHNKLVETGDWFHCPNGHRIHYYTSENQVLKDKLAREQHEREQAQARANELAQRLNATTAHARRRQAALKGHLTRGKRRAVAGTCQFCHRTFSNVSRHMHDQHPTHVKKARLRGAKR